MKDSTEVVEGLTAVMREEMSAPESLSEMERKLKQALVWLGRLVLGVWLGLLEGRYVALKIDCRCGGEARFRYRREGKLYTIFGAVRYRRAYYGCEQCHHGTYPLDERLGLRPNEISAELERLAGLVGVKMAFGQGSAVFEELTLVHLSDHSLDKAAQAYGKEVERQEVQWQNEAQDMDKQLESKREVCHPPRRLYGSMDGGRVHLRSEGEPASAWRELKVGAWFEARGRPPVTPDGEWTIRAENVSYYTDICDADTFSHLVWATGFQRHAQLAHELVILGDGSRWIWDIVAEHFPSAVQIVDWFHACQYLAPVAQVACHTEEERVAWDEQVKTDLWEGRLDEVIAACQQQVKPRRQDDPAHKAVTYFTNNRQRMNYPVYRANGYHIGSGTIESAIKQIGAQRMKIAGARWNLDPARRVAKARAVFLSGDWNQIAEQRALSLRAA